jgi:hypothetical protein
MKLFRKRRLFPGCGLPSTCPRASSTMPRCRGWSPTSCYSSLSCLKRFPADVLKIDQSFVRDIEHDANSTAMVAAIISLSHDLGPRVPVPAREFEQFVLEERYAVRQAGRATRFIDASLPILNT